MFNLRLFFYFSGMNQSPETDFFEIKLSSQGAAFLLRLYKATRWLFTLVIILSAFLLIGAVARYFTLQRYYNQRSLKVYQGIISPVYTVVVTILSLFQVYYYFHFSRTCKKGIEQQQTDLFNSSFKWLFRNTVLACFILVLQIIFFVFDIFSGFFLW